MDLAFRKPDRNDMCVVFWDTAVDEKHVRYVRRLVSIKGCGDYCVLVSKVEDAESQWTLVLCNAVGCPVDSKTINIEPRFVAMSKTHIIVCSEETVYFW